MTRFIQSKFFIILVAFLEFTFISTTFLLNQVSGVLIIEFLVSFLPYIMLAGILFGVLTVLYWFFAIKSIRQNDPHKLFARIYEILTILLITVIFINALHIVSFYFIKPSINSQNQSFQEIKVNYYNKLYNNQNYEEISKQIERIDPDIIGLSEFYESDLENISALQKYEYKFLSTCKCKPFQTDLALFSRYEITDTTSHNIFDAPVIESKIKIRETEVAVFVIHPSAPITAEVLKLRNESLEKNANIISRNTEEYKIVMGDLNTSTWSNNYKKFTEEIGELYNASKGEGISFTWGKYFLKTKIDHIFVSKNIKVKSFIVYDKTGSDHNMIGAKINL